MYVKTGKYGQIAQDQQGAIVGSVNIELLPQGELKEHVELTIEESKVMGKWPEPMLRVSVNNQAPRLYGIHTILKALDIFDQNQSIDAISLHEPQEEA